MHSSLRPLLLNGLLASLMALSPLPSLGSESAGRFYEDALKRYEARDLEGAIVQLKNALQQDKRFLPAQVLMGKASLANSSPGAAEAAFAQALELGASRNEVAPLLAEALMAQGKHKLVLADARLQLGGLAPQAQAQLLNVLAAVHTDLGDERAAAQAIARVRELSPNTPESWLAEATMRLRAQDYKAAQAAVDQALRLRPGLPEAVYLRGSLQQVQGQLSKALETYAEVLRLRPDHLEARISRAAVAVDQGRGDAAREDLRAVRERYPQDPRADYLEALLAERDGDMPRSQAAMKNVANLMASVPLEFMRYRPQMLMLGGLSHHAIGDLGRARAYLELLVRQQPGNGAAKVLAQVHFAQNEIDNGVAVLERYLAATPGDQSAYPLLAAGLGRQGRHERATALMAQALRDSDQPAIRSALGQSLLSAGRVGAARSELENAWKRAPNQVGTGEALAVAYLIERQTDKALQVAKTLAAQRAGDASVQNLLGQCLAAKGDRNGARRAFNEAQRLAPRLPSVTLSLARLDAAEKRWPDAKAKLEQLRRQQPRSVEPLLELASLAHAQRQWPQAREALEQAIEIAEARDLRPQFALVDLYLQSGQAQLGVAAAKRLLAASGEELAAQVALARAQLSASDLAAARGTLVQAGRKAGFEIPALLEIARLQLDAEDPKGSGYTLSKILDERPDHPQALVLQANADLAAGDLSKAETRVKKLQSLRPNEALTHLLAAEVAMARRQPEQALASLRRAHELQPSTATTMRLFLHLSGHQAGEAAAKVAEAWLKRQPKDLVVLRAQAELLATQTGRLNEARSAYERLLALRPDDAPALNNLALILLKLDQPAEAQAKAERAVKLAPGQGIVIDTLAWIVHKRGDHQRALSLLREARSRAPENGEIRYHLAAVLAQLGRRQDAKAELAALRGSPAGLESVQDAQALARSLE